MEIIIAIAALAIIGYIWYSVKKAEQLPVLTDEAKILAEVPYKVEAPAPVDDQVDILLDAAPEATSVPIEAIPSIVQAVTVEAAPIQATVKKPRAQRKTQATVKKPQAQQKTVPAKKKVPRAPKA